jgi:hypothetical protein
MIEVYLTDERFSNYDQARIHFIDASIWAVKNCKSFTGFDIQEVADVSVVWDQVAEYRFADPHDVMLFKLRWS